jgi:membrane-associated PAP2 superfamily phosphatase
VTTPATAATTSGRGYWWALAAILAPAALIAVFLALRPEFDLRIAAIFYDPATRWSQAPGTAVTGRLREVLYPLVIGAIACAFAVAAVRRRRAGQRPAVRWRQVVFLAGTLAIGPGLLVNGVLKDQWARPRPGSVTQFGGTHAFVPWWDPRGTCEQNCSFVSGEVAAAAWTLAPALLVAGPLRPLAIAAAVAFTALVAAQRVMTGGHFFSDGALAAALTFFVIWAGWGLCFRLKPAPRD